MRAEKAGSNRYRARAAEPPRGLQLPAFGVELQTVAGFDLDRRDAFGEQRVEPRQRRRHQLLGAGLPGRLHRRDDSTAGLRDLLVAGTGQPLLEFGGAVAAMDKVGMAVDQARRDPAAVAVGSLFGFESGGGLGGGAGIDDAAAGGGDHAVIDQAEALAIRRKRCKTASVPDVID